MTEEQKKIQFLIDGFHADDDYRDFKTADEYFEFHENRAKDLRAQDANNVKKELFELAKGKSKDIDKWLTTFDSYGQNLGTSSKNVYDFYTELFMKNKIPMVLQFPLFMHIYVHYPVTKGFERYLLEAYDNYPENKKDKLRKDMYDELGDLLDEKGYLTVYRGEYMDDEFGSSIEVGQAISFTLNYEKARFFACRWNARKANVYTAKVAFEDIIYYTDDRNESEVIIRPESKGRKFLDVKCEELNPEEYYKGNTAAAKDARLRLALENGISVEEYMKMHPEYFKK